MKNICMTIVTLLLSSGLFSQSLKQQSWVTEFEKSGYMRTPRYAETMQYFRRFENETPYAKMVTLGVSPQGRNIECLIVSKDKAFTITAAKKTGKAIVVINNGIHSGEIEGKDAAMLLLREILVTKEQEHLLDNVILLVIPIFSVDGHERFSEYNRINQNGPVEMGWRTTAQNINLNRDWVKADAPEMQAMLRFYSSWLPDFFIDSHTTDGADYQYTVTYGIEKYDNLDAGLAGLVKQQFLPFMEKRIQEKGFQIAPYLLFKGEDPAEGFYDYASTPRFSTGYTAVQNRLGLLVETHMLKPYKERVYSTKAMFELVLEFVGKHNNEIIALGKTADEHAIRDFVKDKKAFAVQYKTTEQPEPFVYKGLSLIKDTSEISGAVRITYTGNKSESTIPYYNHIQVQDSIVAPYAYIIPPEWKFIADRLALHGIQSEQVDATKKYIVTKYKFSNVTFRSTPYEGRQTVTCSCTSFMDTVQVASGSLLILTNQRAIRVLLHALEPKSEDSFLRWGFMNSIFERKEYFENYVMERIAAQMIKDDAALKNEFEKKLAGDPEFKKSPDKRLNFFYEHSPYIDKQQNVYPVMRIENP